MTVETKKVTTWSCAKRRDEPNCQRQTVNWEVRVHKTRNRLRVWNCNAQEWSTGPWWIPAYLFWAVSGVWPSQSNGSFFFASIGTAWRLHGQPNWPMHCGNSGPHLHVTSVIRAFLGLKCVHVVTKMKEKTKISFLKQRQKDLPYTLIKKKRFVQLINWKPCENRYNTTGWTGKTKITGRIFPPVLPQKRGSDSYEWTLPKKKHLSMSNQSHVVSKRLITDSRHVLLKCL